MRGGGNVFQRDLSTTCCAPQPGCEYCKRSRRIAETYYEPSMDRRWTRYVHLKEGGGFVDCAIQERYADGQQKG